MKTKEAKNMSSRLIVRLMVSLCCIVAFNTASYGNDEGKNFVRDPGFEDNGVKYWKEYEKGYESDDKIYHSGKQCMRITVENMGDAAGIRQGIVLDQQEIKPLKISGWSKAKEVKRGEDGKAWDYAVWVDLLATDGTTLPAQTACFNTGTHDWEYGELVFTPKKPVKFATVYCFLRGKHKGTVWFDDIFFGEIKQDETVKLPKQDVKSKAITSKREANQIEAQEQFYAATQDCEEGIRWDFPVQEGTIYRFSIYGKSTNYPIRIIIQDVAERLLYFCDEFILNDNQWHKKSIQFRTPYSCNNIKVKICSRWEPPEGFRGNKFWIKSRNLEIIKGAVSDSKPIVEKIKIVKEKEITLDNLLKTAHEKGMSTPYQDVSAQTIEDFLRYTQEDIDDKELSRADIAAEYLIELADDVIKETESLLQTPSLRLDVPRYNITNLRIKDGNLYQGNSPILLLGACSGYLSGNPAKVERGIEQMPALFRYGHNVVAIDRGPRHTLYDWAGLPLEGIFNESKDNNIAVMLSLSPHIFPTSEFERHPEIKSCGCSGHFIEYCVLNPYSRSIIEKHLQKIIPLVKNYPNLNSCCLANEPQFEFSRNCKYVKTEFHGWLKGRYGDVSELNKLWGTDYKEFGLIDIPPLNSQSPVNIAMRYDLTRFYQHLGTAFFAFMTKVIREMDSEIPIHIKFSGNTFDGFRARKGIDEEATQEFCDIAGLDNSLYVDGGEERSSQDFTRAIMQYDLIRSMAPAKPILDTEYHIVHITRFPTIRGQLQAALWEGYIHGVDGAMVWIWDRNYGRDLSRGIPASQHSLLDQPWCVEEVGRTALDLDRMAGYVAGFQNDKSKVAMLCSMPSIINWIGDIRGYKDIVHNIYQGLFFLDTKIDFITEKQVREGKLNNYEVLIIPMARYVHKATYQSIKNYFKEGGNIVVIDNQSLKYDEYGRERDVSDVFKAEKYGKGNRYIISSILCPEEYSRIFDLLLDKWRISRDIRAIDKDGNRIRKLELRYVSVDKDRLVYLINLNQQKEKIFLQFKGKDVNKIYDLIRKRDINDNFIEVEPFTPYLLRICGS